MKNPAAGIFNRIIKSIEADNYPFLIGWTGLFAIITIRNIFESALEGGQLLGFSAYPSRSFYMIFSHYPLFYFALFLCFLLALYLLTGEKIANIAKALIIGMAVIVLPPFIDIIVSRGSGYELKYLRQIEELSQSYRFFNPLKDIAQSSWGQRVEIIFALAGASYYVFHKTKDWLRSLLAPLIFFGIILCFGVIPIFVARIPSYLGFNRLSPDTLITAGLFKIDSQNYSIVFLFLILIAGSFTVRIALKDIHSRITAFKPSLIFFALNALGMIYGWFMIRSYLPFIPCNPVTYMLFAVSLIAVHGANTAALGGRSSPGFMILTVFAVFSAITIGPTYAGLLALFFLIRFFTRPGTRKLPKLIGQTVLGLTAFCAGFSVLFPNAIFSAIIPSGKSAEYGGRQMAGWNHFINRDYHAALEEYLKIREIRTDDEISKRIGQCFLHLGRTEPAIKLLQDIKRPDYETILTLADAYQQTGRIKETIRLYDRAREANIEPGEFVAAAAQLMARQGIREETRSYLTRALAYGIPRFKYHQILGDLYFQGGALDAAREAYYRALAFNPRSVTAHAGMGMIHYRQGDLGGAAREFLLALRFSPNNFALYNNLGAISLLKSDYYGAEGYFTRSLKINPTQVESYYNLGLVADKTNDPQKAREMYRKALAINPDYLPAINALKDTVRDE